MHGVNILQRFRWNAFGHHVGDEGVEDDHVFVQSQLVALFEERNGITGKLGTDEDVRLGGFDLLQHGGIVGGTLGQLGVAHHFATEFLDGILYAVSNIPSPGIGSSQHEDPFLAQHIDSGRGVHVAHRPWTEGNRKGGI